MSRSFCLRSAAPAWVVAGVSVAIAADSPRSSPTANVVGDAVPPPSRMDDILARMNIANGDAFQGLGHPTFSSTVDPSAPWPFGATRGLALPPLNKLARGSFVNFESPPVKALALNEVGTRIYLANTPAGTLSVINTQAAGGLPALMREIPVGLDPVSVAIQPHSGDQLVWVANLLSDDLSVVDIAINQVVAVIPVGDEPCNILFSSDGQFAYVVLQGRALTASEPVGAPASHLVTIDATTRQVVHTLSLPCAKPRAAAIHAQRKQLVIAALHSGNNTATVGKMLQLTPEDIAVGRRFVLGPELLRDFSWTSGAFAASSLAPWPDVPSQSLPQPAPAVMRIVADAGEANDWSSIVSLFITADGTIDPQAVIDFSNQFAINGSPIVNAEQVLTELATMLADTIDNDLLVIDTSIPDAPALSNVVGHVGTTLTGLAFSPGGDRVLLSNLEPNNLIRLVNNLKGQAVRNEIVMVEDPAGGAIVSRVNLDQPNPVPAGPTLANPTDLVYARNGTRAFVAALGGDAVGVLDGTTGAVLGSVGVGRGPRSLALDWVRNRLYVLNRTDLSISTLDVTPGAMPTVLHTLYPFNPESATIKNGRDFLYSAKFSQGGHTSCASCHIDGTLDMLAWDLGDPHGSLLPAPSNLVGQSGPMMNHPLKGPMITQSLRGLDRHNAFHWRGDKPTFEDFNEAFEGLLGGQQVSDKEMSRFAAFAMTINYPPNPFFLRDSTPASPNWLSGAVLFINNCNPCHTLSATDEHGLVIEGGHDGARRNDNGIDDFGLDLNGLVAQIQEITQLRAIHEKLQAEPFTATGTIHDAREKSENNGSALRTFLITFFGFMTPTEMDDLITMVNGFPTNVMPVVGWRSRISGPMTAEQRAELDAILGLADQTPAQCDLVAFVMQSSVVRGFVKLPNDAGIQEFETDDGGTIALDNLIDLVRADGALVFEAVTPGSGRRLGVDWDLDCIPNALDLVPRGTADLDGDGQVALADLTRLLSHFGAQQSTPREAGDIDGDGDVDFSDLALLLARFGIICPQG